ncbi:diguanylate cyclase [Acidimicrobium ferrooxidans DSM 10331]|uniref:Diguanylate cyclase n=1 Tax=Acidimicrobium ferrooxidans (strain DSM 10331 / JCM 15462 / NBRC 103882 / ICP) TaxID=525909 RepID=C7M085_ACIFD|nr:sensor domain-containing diguanylate cyclase [Acidimicrobium ferrooxidans]ACU54393.1 diguanylate cyclase [Acidimicrobium ferrooxidans DSM 10331]
MAATDTTSRELFARISAIVGAPDPPYARLARLGELAEQVGARLIVRDGLGPGTASVRAAPSPELGRAMGDAANLLLRLDYRARAAERANEHLAETVTALELAIDAATREPPIETHAPALALWHLPVALLVVDEQQRICFLNPQAARLLQLDGADVLGSVWTRALASLGEAQLDRIRGHFRASGHFRGVATVPSGDDGRRYLAIDAATVHATSSHAARPLVRVMLWDATHAAVEASWLQWTATHDPLTGLLNRAGLTEHLRTWGERPLPGLIWLDIAGFSDLNRALGHRVADEILRHVADSIMTELGPDDLAARVGSDEFAILVADGAAAKQRRWAISQSASSLGRAAITADIAVSLRSAVATHPRPGIERSAADAVWEELGRLARISREISHPAARGRRRFAPRGSHQPADELDHPSVRWIRLIDVATSSPRGHELVLTDRTGRPLRDDARRDHAAGRYDRALLGALARTAHPGGVVAVRLLEPSHELLRALKTSDRGSTVQVTLEADDLVATPERRRVAATIAREAHALALRVGLDLGERHGGELQLIAALEPEQIVMPLHPRRTRPRGPLAEPTTRLVEGLAAFSAGLGCEFVVTNARVQDLVVLREIAERAGGTIIAALASTFATSPS